MIKNFYICFIQKIPVVFFIFYCATMPGYGQTGHFISTANGLNTNNLTSIIRDKKDYMWIGSYNGLHRHEGSRIQVYNHKGNDSGSLRSGEMHAFFEDRRGFMWVGTTAGLDKLNPQTGKIVHFNLKLPQDNSPFIGYIYNINQDRNDDIWVTTGAGFFVLDYETGRYKYLDGSNGKPGVNLYYDINPGGSFVSSKGIWFNTMNSGLIFYDYASGLFLGKHYNPQSLPIFNIGTGNNSDIYSDNEQHIYFISNDSLLVRYNLQSAKIEQYVFSIPKNSWHGCQSVCGDNNGNIWMGFRNGGLLVFNQALQTFTPIRHSADNTLLPGDYVFDVAKDYRGDMWVTTDEGISIINTETSVAKEIFLTDIPEIRNMSVEPSIISIDPQGKIYIPYFGKHLFVHNTTSGITNSYQKSTSGGGLYVLPVNQNKIFIGTDNNGLQELRLVNGKASTTGISQDPPGMDIAREAGNILWAHRFRNGHYLVKNLDDQLFYFQPGKPVISFTNPGFMKQSYLPTHENHFWYIGDRHSLIKFDLKTLIPDTVSLSQLLAPSGFLFSNPRDLFEDAQGMLWITSQNGLLYYDPAVDGIKPYTIENGLSHGFTFALNTDLEDRLWVASLGGIDYFDASKNVFRNVYKSQNSKYMESFGSSVRTSSGDIYFLFGNRLVMIRAGLLKKSKTAMHRFYWNDIQVNGRSISTDSLAASGANFTYDHNRFNFNFGLLDFKDGDKTGYSYFVEGLDTSWIDLRNRSSLLFNTMPPGKYTLHIKAVSASYPGKAYTLDFPFTVGKPYWQQEWFYGILVLLGGLLLFGLIRWRETNIKVINDEKFKVQQLKAENYKKELELEQIINYFSSSLIDKNTIDEVLWDVAKNLIGRLGFEDCMMYLWNKDRTKMVQRAGYGPKDSIEDFEKLHFDVGPGQGLVGYVMQTKEPVLVPDTSLDRRYRVDDVERLSEITVPIIYNDELIGVIDSEHHARNFFTRQHLQVLSTIATLVGNKVKSIESEQSLQQAKIEMHSINEKLSEAKLEALRSQMNPHFIFNSLNAIQECILTGKVDAAYSYLSQFSRLQRMVLQHSEKEFISLSSEVEILKLYLSLESLRFNQSFSYSINMDDIPDADEVMIPSMLLQPYVENAIWHGLRNKEGEKVLTISGREQGGDLVILIDDNGVGRTRAAEIKMQKLGADAVESRGTIISSERIQILSLKYKAGISVEMIDKTGKDKEATGTTVIIRLPSEMITIKP